MLQHNTALAFLNPSEAHSAGPSRIGGKAAGLVRLLQAGATVPAWCVLPSAGLTWHLGQTPGLAACLAAALSELMPLDANDPATLPVFQAQAGAMQRALLAAPLSGALVEAINDALRDLHPGPWAVRSSMVGEDSAQHSFAGQLESFLGLRTQAEVRGAVCRCWASAFSAHALMYRARAGQPMTDLRVAVILQQMVEGSVSGVLFTAHPGTGRRDHALVSATWGLAQGVVSGRCNTDEFTFDRQNRLELHAHIGSKDLAITSAPEGGIQESPVPVARQRERCLTPAQVLALCEAGAHQEAAFGAPLDIEWTLTPDNTLYFLQARPITRLPEPVPQDGPRRIFDSSNIQESFSGVTTPLTFSFVAEFYRRSFAQLMPELGADPALMRACEPLLQNLIALVAGRMYYSLGAWYEGLKLLPSYAHNKASMERMMGIDVSIDDGAPPTFTSQVKALPRALNLLAHLKLRFLRLHREVPAFLAHVEGAFARIDRKNFKNKSFSALMADLAFLRAQVLDRWTSPILNDIHMMMSVGKLRRIVERATDPPLVDPWMSTLLSSDHLASVAPTRLLLDIAQKLRAQPDCLLLLSRSQPAPQKTLDALRDRCPEVASLINAYLDQFGDRCIGELKLETISLHEDPRFLLEVLRNYTSFERLPSPPGPPQQRAEIEAKLKQQAAWRDRWRVVSVLEGAREAVHQREQMRMARTKLFGIVRDLYLALGARLTDLGRLPSPRQVLYLTVDELDAFFEGRAVTLDLAALTGLRAAEFRAFESSPMPDRFYTQGPVYQTQPSAAQDNPTAATLQGVGCYPGVVEAQVQTIHAAQGSLPVNGRVLVAFQTDPGWTPLLPTAAGVLIERGSTLSHVAIVARELHIPIIVNIPHLTQTLHTGDTIRMDGASGSVERLGHMM